MAHTHDTTPTPRKLTTSQIKVGDVLIRRADHIGRPDARYRVARVTTGYGPRRFVLDGYYCGASGVTAKTLTAENLRTVERDGQIIGVFFAKYW